MSKRAGSHKEPSDKKKGGRRGWATPEQEEWLRSRVPSFIAAQTAGVKALADFWPSTMEAWFSTWPEPTPIMLPPTIWPASESAENQESSPTMEGIIANNIQKRKLHIKQWYNNHTRAGASTETKSKLLDLQGKKTKKLQPAQAYSRLYYESKLKSIVAERWEEHLLTNPDKATKTGPPLPFRNKVIRELYQAEAPEVKAEVEKRRDVESDVELEIEDGEDFDEEEMKRRAKAVAYQRFHNGKTPLGNDFGEAYEGWHEGVEKPFIAHLYKCFPSNICESRALPGTSFSPDPPQLADNSRSPSVQPNSATPHPELLRRVNHGRSSTPSESGGRRKANLKSSRLVIDSEDRSVSSNDSVDDGNDEENQTDMEVQEKTVRRAKSKQEQREANIQHHKAIVDGLSKEYKGRFGDANSSKAPENPDASKTEAMKANEEPCRSPRQSVSTTSSAANGLLDSPPINVQDSVLSSTTISTPDGQLLGVSEEISNTHSAPGDNTPEITSAPPVNPEPITQTVPDALGGNASEGVAQPALGMFDTLFATCQGDAGTGEAGENAVTETTTASPNIPSQSAAASLSFSSSNTDNVLEQYSDRNKWPLWLGPAITYLEGISESPQWVLLVSKLIILEGCLDFPTAPARLDCAKRPDIVYVWFKNGRKYQSPPKIEDLHEFSQSWWVWWKTLQPEWRSAPDGSLSRHLPKDEQWVQVCKGGNNGVFVVILTLAWWLLGLDGNDEEHDFGMALEDTIWVFDCMIASNRSLKRLCNDPDSDVSNKKRKMA